MNTTINIKKNDKVTTKDTKIHSFDIFDTLLTRRVATPYGIFKLIQYHLKKDVSIPAFLSENFLLIRTETEMWYRNHVYNKNKQEDVTLDEIYNTIQTNYNIDPIIIEKIKKLEIETEINNIIPIKENIELLKSLKEDPNNEVILISDMYLPLNTIKRMLDKLDPCFKDIKLYLSCEEEASKHYGSLFDVVQKKENINIKNWTHYGDNPHADENRAKERGISVKLVPSKKTNELYKYITKQHSEDVFPDAILGIASNLTRYNKSSAYALGCNITAPLLYSYVDWVINNSITLDKKDLFFVARDGYILKIIADEIIKHKNLDIKTHYIYGSRIAWRLITEENIDANISAIFANYKKDLNIEKIAKQLQISANEIVKYIGKTKKIKKVKNKMLNSKEFKEYLINEHKDKISILSKYIKQECGFNRENITFVEFDGSGHTQDCLYDNIKENFAGNITTYYFMLFYKSNINNKSEKKSYFNTYFLFVNWIERLTRTLEGQTLGYKMLENGKIEPILEYFNTKKLEKWGFNDYICAIKDFTNEIMHFEEINNLKIDTRKFFICANNYIQNPEKNDFVKTIAQIPFEDMHKSANTNGFKFIDCVKMLIGKYETDSFSIFDYKCSSIIAQLIYLFHIKYKSIRKFLFHINIRTHLNKLELIILGVKIDLSNLFWIYKKNRRKNHD